MEANLIHQLIKAVNQEYAKRYSKNKKYSLRAYARYLNIDASHLHKFIRGKKGLSRARLALLGKKLNLSENWLQEVQATNRRGKKPSELYKQMDEAQIRRMQHWYYAAITELPLLRGFQPAPEWIAKKIDISVAQATEALSALQSNGIIINLPAGAKKKNSLVRPVSWSYYLPGQTSSERRENQKQFLRRAIAAMDEIPIERREQSSMVMATDVKNLPQARLLTQKFRRDMSRLLKKGENCKELYLMSISLFPLTKGPG